MHCPKTLRHDLGEFFRDLRAALGGGPFPYLWVPEWHKSGHGLHVHFAVGRYIKRSLIEEAWVRGFVHIKLLGDLPVGASAVDEARRASSYLSKYLQKDFGRLESHGLHRYDRAQGFQPVRCKVEGGSFKEAYFNVCAEMGGEVPRVVSPSVMWPDWAGPFAVAMSWG